MTAGELIRQAINDGATALGLAKRMAGSNDDADPEVQRLRFVFQRAADGGEPNALNAKQIGEFFGKKIERPRRRRAAEPDRLAELEASFAAEMRRRERALRAVTRRLAEFEGRLALLEQRGDHPQTGRGQR